MFNLKFNENPRLKGIAAEAFTCVLCSKNWKILLVYNRQTRRSLLGRVWNVCRYLAALNRYNFITLLFKPRRFFCCIVKQNLDLPMLYPLVPGGCPSVKHRIPNCQRQSAMDPSRFCACYLILFHTSFRINLWNPGWLVSPFQDFPAKVCHSHFGACKTQVDRHFQQRPDVNRVSAQENALSGFRLDQNKVLSFHLTPYAPNLCSVF